MPARHSRNEKRHNSNRHGSRWTTAAGRLVRVLLAAVLLAALVFGLPWGLIYFVGWPLPHRLPSWADIATTLTSPMSTTFLTDAMACILWPVWGLFVLDVAGTAAQAARGLPVPAVPKAGPLQSLAAVLVSTIVLSLLSTRSAAPAAAASASPRSHVTATAPAASAELAAEPTGMTGPAPFDSRTRKDSVTVRVPSNGVYDSLWRIADRTLGDGSRWPEIYTLNRGRPQPDGHTLTNPNLVRPGWILRLPSRPSHLAGSHKPPRSTPPAPPTTAPTPSHTATPETPSTTAGPSPSVTPASPSAPPSVPSAGTTRTDVGHAHHSPGLNLPTGAFVGAGMAAIVAGALLTVRLRHRIRYRPGSGERDDLAVAPVVRALRIAHDQATAESELFPGVAEAATEADSASGRTVGVRDGQAVAWDLARTRGLGLIGPGAPDAARALLISLLTDHPAEVLIPRADAALLLDATAAERRQPGGLHIVDDLGAALDAFEGELLRRTRTTTDPRGDEAVSDQEVVLVATPAAHADRRLQAILDNGSTLGLAGILLGQRRPGGTLRVRNDGTVAAVSPDLAEVFAGARLFNLPADDARALLDLFADAGPTAEPPSPSRPLRTASDQPAPTRTSPRSGSTTNRSRPARRRLGPGSHQGTTTLPAGGDSDAGARQGPVADVRDEADPHPAPAAATPTPALSRVSVRTDATALRPLELAVVGRIRLTHHLAGGDTHADLTGSLAPKHREVLTYLALHPDGVRREALAGAIWPDAPRNRPYNSFHATLSQLRRALRIATHDEQTDITVHFDGHYALDRTQVSVDLWDIREALRAGRHYADDHRAALERVLALYTGDLAVEITAEWVEAPREALRRDVLDVIGAEVSAVREADPEQALRLLEHARALDLYNEAVYRGIGRLQARMGRRDAVPRTLALLTTALAELDAEPSQETVDLFAALQLPRHTGRTRQERAAG